MEKLDAIPIQATRGVGEIAGAVMTNATYQSIPIRECGEPLLALSHYSFILEPKYYQRGLSDTPKLYAREGIVTKPLKIYSSEIYFSFTT